MDFLATQIAAPRSWDLFEDLIRALFAEVYNNPLAAKNGRRGQPQHGVDVFVELPTAPGQWIGIQCKGKEQSYGARATIPEFDAELAKAEHFEPRLTRWIFTTTAPLDAKLQAHARKESKARSRNGKFPVDYLGWDALVDLIAQHEPVIRQFYAEHLQAPDDVRRLAQASAQALASIDDTLRHGTAQLSLLRPESVAPARRALDSESIIRLTGEGGGGKSAVLKRLTQSFAGPMLVLKDNRVAAGTLAQHLSQLGITTSAVDLLDRIAKTGSALLVIDGADRLLMSERRSVVLDLFRALVQSEQQSQWQILTSARRYQDRDLVADALSEAGFTTSGVTIAVEGLTPEDGDTLALAFPAFAPLVRRKDLGDQIRSLFLLRELLGRKAPPAEAWTELDIADAWVASEIAEPSRRARRSKALAELGRALVSAPWQLSGRADLDSEGLQALLDEGAVIQLPNRDAIRLAHDVHEDWLLARQLHARAEELPQLLADAREPLWWLRAVRLCAQIYLESGDYTGWRALLAQLDAVDALDPVWARAVMAAPLYSERADAVLGALAPALLEDEAQLLTRLLDTLLVSETRLDERILAYLADRDEATRYAMAAYRKQPHYRSWVPFLRWSLPLWTSWPPALIPRLSEIAMIFARQMTQVPNGFSQKLARIALGWLVEIEDIRQDRDWENRREPFDVELDGYWDWERIEERLREVLVDTASSAPRAMETYLTRVTTGKEMGEARSKLIESPGTVPTLLPRQWAAMCARQFTPPRRRAYRDSLLGPQLFGWHDYHRAGLRGERAMSPSSPLRAGFEQLFEADAEAALSLFHRLERRASIFWRWYQKCHDRQHPRPVILDLPTRQVVLWGDDPVYRWCRGILGSEVLGSAYLALDDWLEREVKRGTPIDSLIERVLQNHGLVGTAAPLIAILAENVNTPGVIDQAAPFLASPKLWEYDVRRRVDDLGFAHRIGYFSSNDVHFEARERNHQRHTGRGPLHHSLLLPFRLLASPAARARFDDARASWTHADIADFTEELDEKGLVAERSEQIERYRSDGDPKQIVFEEAEQGIKVTIAPPKESEEDVAALNFANATFAEATKIANWVRATREQGSLAEGLTLKDAMARAAALSTALDAPDNPHLGLAQQIGGGAIMGVAAIAARYLDADDLATQREWIERWLRYGANVPDRDDLDDDSLLFDDFQVYAAWGIATLACRAPHDPSLDALAAKSATHHLVEVAQSTLKGLDWSARPGFARALHIAALDTCVADYGWWWRGPRAQAAAKRRRRRARARATWRALSARPSATDRAPYLPPAPDSWRLIWTGKWPVPLRILKMPAKRMLAWHRALKLFEVINWHEFPASADQAAKLGRYLSGLVEWTRAYSEDTDRHDRQFPYEWGHGLAKALGRFALARGESGHWQALRTFSYHDRAEDLVGDYLDAMTTDLIVSGQAPDSRFWTAWQPAADWLLERLPRSRGSHDYLGHGVSAAGMVGPYSTPIPPDWPHLELVLETVNRWVEATQHLPAAAYTTLAIIERMNTDQRARWYLRWLSRWTAAHSASTSFWHYNAFADKAAVLLKPLAESNEEIREQCRKILAFLADSGSTAARELVATFAASRRGW